METPSGPHESPHHDAASGAPFSVGRRVVEAIQVFPTYDRTTLPDIGRDELLSLVHINTWMISLRRIINEHATNHTSPYTELRTQMIEIRRWMNDPTRTSLYRPELRGIFTIFLATLNGWVQMLEDEIAHPNGEDDEELELPHGPNNDLGKYMRIKDKFRDPWPVMERLVDLVHKIQFNHN